MIEKHIYNFSAEKNHKLIKERKISFEEAIAVIESDSLLDIIEHPNPQKYSNQQMYVIELNNYIYLVPFVTEIDGTIFLKTIIPSRKATEKYLKKKNKDE